MPLYVAITGGSSGLGYELAKLAAADGHDLFIGGSASEQRVTAAVDELRAQYPDVKINGIATDLATSEGVEAFIAGAKQRAPSSSQIDVLILNAAISLAGSFLEIPLEEHLRLLSIDITAYVRIAHALLPSMVSRGQGKVLITSSLSATTPTPYESVYGPTKAFLSSFADGLREELIGTGVQVTGFHPGATATSFHARAGFVASADSDPSNNSKLNDNSWKDDPVLVAKQGYQGLLRGQTTVVGGDVATHRAWEANHVLPGEEKARRFAEMARPRGK